MLASRGSRSAVIKRGRLPPSYAAGDRPASEETGPRFLRYFLVIALREA
jgi:hypothetical protein